MKKLLILVICAALLVFIFSLVPKIIRNGVEDLIIVTQEFHLARSLYIANQLGIKASGLLADKAEYFYNKSFNTREQLATFKAIFDTLFNLKPKTTEIRQTNPAFES